MPGIEIKGRSKIANYRHGGRAGFVHGSVAKVAKIAARKFRKPPGVFKVKGKKTHGKDVPTMAAEGGRIGLKKGGSDKKWIQKAVDPKHKGYCTPMTKKTCTPARKALARTFKKKAKTGWGQWLQELKKNLKTTNKDGHLN